MKAIRVILTVVFGWGLWKSIDLLFRQDSIDLFLFQAIDRAWLFYALLSIIAVTQAVTLVWLWKPFSRGHLFAVAAVWFNLTETIVACSIAAGNVELAKQAFITSRESRGLTVRPEMLEMMNNSAMQYIPLVMTVPLAILWCVLIYLLVRANRQGEEPAV